MGNTNGGNSASSGSRNSRKTSVKDLLRKGAQRSWESDDGPSTSSSNVADQRRKLSTRSSLSTYDDQPQYLQLTSQKSAPSGEFFGSTSQKSSSSSTGQQNDTAEKMVKIRLGNSMPDDGDDIDNDDLAYFQSADVEKLLEKMENVQTTSGRSGRETVQNSECEGESVENNLSKSMYADHQQNSQQGQNQRISMLRFESLSDLQVK